MKKHPVLVFTFVLGFFFLRLRARERSTERELLRTGSSADAHNGQACSGAGGRGRCPTWVAGAQLLICYCCMSGSTSEGNWNEELEPKYPDMAQMTLASSYTS